MRAILHEIRRQPLWARELMFVFSVITTVSLVGMAWFHSFQQNLYAMYHPGENIDEQRYFAEGDDGRSFLAALVGDGMSALKGSVYDVLNIDNQEEVDSAPKAVYPMPIAPDAN